MELARYLGKGNGFVFLMLALLVLFGIVFVFTFRSSRREITGQILFPVFFIEAAFIFFVVLLNFPAKKQAGIGASVVPLIWIVGITAFSILLLVKALLRGEEPDPEWGRVGVVFSYLGGTILYIILMNYIGYFIATALFLVASMYFLHYRNWKVMVSVAAGWVLFSYFAFYRLLYVPLPKGTLLSWAFG
jgi:hypothetical protein